MTWDHSLTRLLFVNDTATTGTYTLSLHDALPICEEELDARVHADDVAAIALGRRGVEHLDVRRPALAELSDRKSTRLNSSHTVISYAVFCLKKKKNEVIALRALITTLDRGPVMRL